MKDLNEKVLSASADEKELSALVIEYNNFIVSTASKITGRYISKSDDEWSVSLAAFTESVHTFSPDKGRFLSFASMVIRRRLIDYIRTQGKYKNEISIDPVVFSADPYDQDEPPQISQQVIKNVSTTDDDSIKYEIEAITDVFSEYGFSFLDLADSSPKAQKTKAACAKAAAYIINTPIVFTQIRSSKTLPIKIIEKNSHVPRKILERHRKYIIAAVEIISGNYPYLAEYMQPIREELKK